MMNYSNEERKVIELSKALLPIHDIVTDRLEALWWYDWDANCHYCDMVEVSQAFGDYQVIRHIDVEMNNPWETIRKGEDMPSWSVFEEDELDWNEAEEGDEDQRPWADVWGFETEDVIEWGQHWINMLTGQVTFIGRPFAEDNTLVANEEQPFEVIREGSTFYNKFNDYYGNNNYIDLSVHPNLIKRGYEALDLFGERGYETTPVIRYPSHSNPLLNVLAEKEMHVLMSELISNNTPTETMLKIGGWKLIGLYNKDERYYTAYRIALRNNYEAIGTEKWLSYLADLMYLDKDISNAKFTCPADLQQAIDAISRQVQRKREREAMAEEERRAIALEESRKANAEKNIKDYEENGENYEVTHKALKGHYLGIRFYYRGICFTPMQSVHEMLEIANNTNQCIYRLHYFKHTDRILFKAEINGTYLETIDIYLSSGEVKECRGKGNHSSKWHELILKGIELNKEQVTNIYHELNKQVA